MRTRCCYIPQLISGYTRTRVSPPPLPLHFHVMRGDSRGGEETSRDPWLFKVSSSRHWAKTILVGIRPVTYLSALNLQPGYGYSSQGVQFEPPTGKSALPNKSSDVESSAIDLIIRYGKQAKCLCGLRVLPDYLALLILDEGLVESLVTALPLHDRIISLRSSGILLLAGCFMYPHIHRGECCNQVAVGENGKVSHHLSRCKGFNRRSKFFILGYTAAYAIVVCCSVISDPDILHLFSAMCFHSYPVSMVPENPL